MRTSKDNSPYNRQPIHNNVAIGKRGELIYEGSTASTDWGSDFIGVSDVTVIGWIKARSLGGDSAGKLFDNGKFLLSVTTGNLLRLTSNNNANTVDSENNSVSLNEWIHVAVTRTSDGIANIYIDGQLSGSPNQDSGTPVAGTVNVFQGNNSVGNRAFDGSMLLAVYNRIFTSNEIAKDYDKTKRKMF